MYFSDTLHDTLISIEVLFNFINPFFPSNSNASLIEKASNVVDLLVFLRTWTTWKVWYQVAMFLSIWNANNHQAIMTKCWGNKSFNNGGALIVGISIRPNPFVELLVEFLGFFQENPFWWTRD